MLLVPTRRRLSKLKTFVDSARMAETTCPAMLLVDKQDWLENVKEYQFIQDRLMPNDDWKFVITEAEGMGPKVREVWPRLIERGCNWVAILNDDHYIVTKHWDQKVLSKLDGENFITTADRWNAPMRAAGATVFSMDLLRAWGFPMFPPEIDHLGIDDVFEIIGKNTGCWYIDMSVVVEHHHVYQDPKRMDDTHKKVYGEGPWPGSPPHLDTAQRFQKFVAETLPGCIERTKLLQNNRLKFDETNDPFRPANTPPPPKTARDKIAEAATLGKEEVVLTHEDYKSLNRETRRKLKKKNDKPVSVSN